MEASTKTRPINYIVFEGLEGSGKSTQVKLFYEVLRKENPKCILAKEPDYESKLGKMIKSELLEKSDPLGIMGMQLLFVAERYERFIRFTIPKMEAGHTIISDRNWFSTAVHVAAFAPKPYSDLGWISEVHSKLPLPQIVFFIDVSPKVAFERINSRGDEKRQYDKVESLEAQEGAYRQLSKKYETIWCRIDGNQSPNDVHKDVMRAWQSLGSE
ncbi:MAG: dTMP kinase [Candidatus Micrarchaeota archaeon]|nr:dTMP kinase [Candidatus Micrarchaeota archaeon]